MRQDECKMLWEIWVDIATQTSEHKNLQLGVGDNYFGLKVNHFMPSIRQQFMMILFP